MKLKHLYFISLVLIAVSCNSNKNHLAKISAKTIAIDSTIISDSDITSIIDPYKQKLSSEMNKILCYALVDFVKYDGNMQSSLGNLMADLSYEIANPIFKELTNSNIDFVLFNYGGMRAIIPKTEVTTEVAYKLMPFENQLVVATLSGTKVIELFNYFTNRKRAHPLSKQVQLTIKGDEYALLINGKPFDKNKTYNVLTSDYLQNGGDNMVFFKEPKKLTNLNLKVREAIIQYFAKVDTLKANFDNRVIIQ